MNSVDINVTKRDGSLQKLSTDKILTRLSNLSNDTPAGRPQLKNIDIHLIAEKVITQIYDRISTEELDDQSSRIAVDLITTHPDYAELAARIVISNHQKKVPRDFVSAMRELRHMLDHNGHPAPIISDETLSIVEKYQDDINKTIQHDRDFLIDYFGFKTLEKSYLLKNKGKPIESPQYLWMRVAIGIHGDNIGEILKTYNDISLKKYTHATPTLFNAGTLHPQMSSCFLIAMKDDSIDAIYRTAHECALISKWGGGIGLHIHNIRAEGSYIRGTSGTSNGIVPMLRVFNATARYCDQGGGKRKGSFAIYLEPWHADIESFLRLKLNTGGEEERARDLFYGLWIPDLFMERVKAQKDWTLFCPDRARGLSDCYGDAFNELYLKYERNAEAYGGKTISAVKLWNLILMSQVESGTPYLLYKDSANKKSNQKNLGVIKSSNLCTEIIEYSSPDETAVCNLASINLQAYLKPSLLNPDKYIFDFEDLRETTKQIVRNLDKVIDRNFYPTEATKRSNFRHRPIGIGVQGLADVFARLCISYDCDEARILNKRIFAHMYYAAVESSIQLAKEFGSYETFDGSPASEGIIQPDMWDGVSPEKDIPELDWGLLREKVKTGLRNSLLIAPMPTASTSQILGNNESFEPFTTNIYARRTLAGEFIIVNQYLVKDLIKIGLWNKEMKDNIIIGRGSIQHISEIPEDIRNRYKTIWEISQRVIIDMAADRGAYICQSQSMNLYSPDPTFRKLSSMHFYAWSKGLKTGQYYLRTRPAAEAQQFSIDVKATDGASATTSLSSQNGDTECLVCSS
jgi:ribonucleoside-diphosphate reductase alpha chain